MEYLDKLPEECRVQKAGTAKKGEELLKDMAVCGIETVVLKYRHPEFPYVQPIPSTPVSDEDCTFHKITSLPLESNERGEISMACTLRGIIGKDPDKVSNKQIRRALKKNAAKLLETTRDFSANCSSEDFQDIDFESMYDKIMESDKCMAIEIIRQAANAELYEDKEDLDNNDHVEEQNKDIDKGVMEVVEEQM